MKKSTLLLCRIKVGLLQILCCLFFKASFCQNMAKTTIETNSIVVSCPGDYDLICGQNAQEEFDIWINSFGYSGSGNVITTDLSGYVVPQPGETIEVFYLAADIFNFDYCKVRFSVPNCNTTFCTYTQGFYGNCNGKGCTTLFGQVKSQEIMKYAILNHNGEYNFGSTLTGNYFKLTSNDIFGNPNVCANNIFKLLPGGGSASPLHNFSTYSNFSTWSDNSPINATNSNFGKINNVLLSQTITMFFNLELNPDLNNLELQSEFSTAATTYCGSNVANMETLETFYINQDVLRFLKLNYGESTVKNLFILANKALGNENIGNLSYAKINEAVDAINRGFDKCRIQVANSEIEFLKSNANISTDFIVSPTPFKDVITVKYLFEEETSATIQIYDLKGNLLFEVNDNDAYLNKEYKIDIPFKFNSRDTFLIKIETSSGRKVKTIYAE